MSKPPAQRRTLYFRNRPFHLRRALTQATQPIGEKAFFLSGAEKRGHPLQPKAAQTLKLSPQPHSPLTFGLRKLKASFSPSLTKSTSVPSISARLSRSTTT